MEKNGKEKNEYLTGFARAHLRINGLGQQLAKMDCLKCGNTWLTSDLTDKECFACASENPEKYNAERIAYEKAREAQLREMKKAIDRGEEVFVPIQTVLPKRSG